jgi:hypothetical protein
MNITRDAPAVPLVTVIIQTYNRSNILGYVIRFHPNVSTWVPTGPAGSARMWPPALAFREPGPHVPSCRQAAA